MKGLFHTLRTGVSATGCSLVSYYFFGEGVFSLCRRYTWHFVNPLDRVYLLRVQNRRCLRSEHICMKWSDQRILNIKIEETSWFISEEMLTLLKK